MDFLKMQLLYKTILYGLAAGETKGVTPSNQRNECNLKEKCIYEAYLAELRFQLHLF